MIMFYSSVWLRFALLATFCLVGYVLPCWLRFAFLATFCLLGYVLPSWLRFAFLATLYFFKLSICGGPDMAPALPQLADTRFGPWKQKRRGLVGLRRLSCVWRHGLFVRPWLPCAQLMGASRRTVGK